MDSYDQLYIHHALVVVAVYHFICDPRDYVFQLMHASIHDTTITVHIIHNLHLAEHLD
jgi:hypothetical protein